MPSHAIALPRVSAATILSAVMTAALLLLMQDLIRHRGPVPDYQPITRIVDIVRLPLDEAPPEPKERVPPPAKVEPPPETVLPKTFIIGEPGTGLSPILPPSVGDGPARPHTGLPDGDLLPIVKVAPVYPRNAITRGIEGFVLLEFAVDEKGQVQAPRVIESEPRGVFDQAALGAVRKFRYKPLVQNGAPIRVEGVLHRLTFELDDV